MATIKDIRELVSKGAVLGLQYPDGEVFEPHPVHWVMERNGYFVFKWTGDEYEREHIVKITRIREDDYQILAMTEGGVELIIEPVITVMDERKIERFLEYMGDGPISYNQEITGVFEY